MSAIRKLAWHNRQVLAERLGWPDGVLEACERAEVPGWWVMWNHEDKCFTATHQTRQISYRYARSQTIEGLLAKVGEADIQAAQQLAEWQLFTPRGWSVVRGQ